MGELFTILIITGSVRIACFPAMLVYDKCTKARVLNLLNLFIRRGVVLPCINKVSSAHPIPNTSFRFFFTGKYYGRNGNNNKSYFFHGSYLLKGLRNKLIAIGKIITIYIGILTIAWNAFIRCYGFAFAAILKLLNLIAWGSIVIPLMNNNTIINGLIPAILAAFILIASKEGDCKNGDGNGYFFHNSQYNNKTDIMQAVA